MKERLPEDNLEQFFRDKLNEDGLSPAGSGWDTPSPGVWDHIQADMPTTPPGKPVWWRWGIGGASAALILALGYYIYTANNRIDSLSETVNRQQAQIDAMHQARSEQPEVKSITTDSSFSNHNLSNSTNSISSNTQATTPPVSDISNQATSQSSTTTVEDKPLLKQNKPSTPSAADASKIDIQGHSKQSTPASASENSKNDTPLPAPTKSVKEPIAQASSEQSEVIPDQPSEQTSLAASQRSIDALSPISGKTSDLATTSSADSISWQGLPLLSPTSKSRKQLSGQFYVGAHIGPTYGYRKVVSNSRPVLRRLLNQQETADFSYSSGFKIGYQLSNNWFVESGMAYLKSAVQSKHAAQVRYTAAQEQLNSLGEWQSNYDLNLATSFGEIGTDVAVTRSTGINIAENDFIRLRVRTSQKLETLRVPLIVGYQFNRGRIGWRIQTGISANFLLDDEILVQSVSSQRNGVRHKSTRILERPEGLRERTYDYILGFGANMAINSKLHFYLEPTLTHSITPIYDANSIKTYTQIFSMNTGVAYYF